jgi:hypothetical protein
MFKEIIAVIVTIKRNLHTNFSVEANGTVVTTGLNRVNQAIILIILKEETLLYSKHTSHNPVLST